MQCRAVLYSAVQYCAVLCSISDYVSALPPAVSSKITMVFKSVQSKYVASYFQLTACGATLVLAVSHVEME